MQRQQQERKLYKQLNRIKNVLPYFRNVGQSSNIQLEDFPVTNKQIYIQNFELLNTAGFNYDELYKAASSQEESREFKGLYDGYTIGLSSGTSGHPGIILVSAKERALWVATVFKRVIGIKFRKRKVAFFLRANSTLYEAVNSRLIEFKFFDLTRPFNELVNELQSYEAQIVVAPATVLQYLTEQLNDQTMKKVEQVISVAEVLDDLSKEKIVKGFNQAKLSQVYQATEGFLGYTCQLGRLHLNQAQIHFEFKTLEAAENDDLRRELIITDFIRTVQPMIRYKMGDVVRLSRHPCSCGDASVAIDAIEGRQEDCLEFVNQEGRKVILFPDVVRQWVIRSSKEVSEFRVVQKSLQSIEVFLNVADDAKIKDYISNQFEQFFSHNNVSHNVNIVFELYKLSGELWKKNRRVIKDF